MSAQNLLALRAVSGTVGVIIVIGAIVVGAPFLALIAVPFLVAAVLLRRGSRIALGGLALWSLVYVVISVNFAIGNGFDAVWSDLLGVYVGGPLAAAAAVLAVRAIMAQREVTNSR